MWGWFKNCITSWHSFKKNQLMKKILGIILIFGCMFFGAIGASIGNSVLAVFLCLSSLILGIYLISKSEEDEYKPSPEKKITPKKEYSEISFHPKIKETKPKQIISSIEEKTIKKLSKEIVKPIEKTIENRFVHYTSNLNDNENSYPILKIPNENCIIRTHRIGTTKRKGFKDESFEKSISKLLSNKFEVSGNIRLNTGKLTRPFEPDIAIICSTNKNIRIDIEIDEPYAGITRQPSGQCR